MRISDWSSDVCSSDLLLLDQGDTLRHLSLRQGGERLAVEKHAAVSRPADAGKQFQQGRFSGSVGSDQPKGLARAHGEIDARDNREAARRPAEVLRFECHLATFPRSRIRAKAGAPTDRKRVDEGMRVARRGDLSCGSIIKKKNK